MVPEVHTKCSRIALAQPGHSARCPLQEARRLRREKTEHAGREPAPHCDLHQLISGHAGGRDVIGGEHDFDARVQNRGARSRSEPGNTGSWRPTTIIGVAGLGAE